MRSPPRNLREGLACWSLTRTLPCSTNCRTRARLTSPSCETRYWSSRLPASSPDEIREIGYGSDTGTKRKARVGRVSDPPARDQDAGQNRGAHVECNGEQ